ncbi:MAG: translation initiation factor IF-2 [Bacteroidales bacterium]|nr:translation initiation factor IF-2 [Bacteroidales bacterium]
MSEESNFSIRLSKAAKEFNVGRETIVEFLTKKGFQVDPSPNTKLTSEMYALLVKEYQGERDVKNEAKKLGDLSYKGGSVSVDSAVQSLNNNNDEDDTDEVFIRTSTISPQIPVEKPAPAEVVVEKKKEEKPEEKKETPATSESPLKVVGKIDLDSLNPKTRPDKKSKEEKQREAKEKAEREKAEKAEKAKQAEAAKKAEAAAKKAAEEAEKAAAQAPVEPKFIKTEVQKLEGPKILDKIELPEERKRSKQQPVASSEASGDSKKKKRKRIAGKPENVPGKAQPEPQGKKNPKKEKGKPQPKREEKVELSDEEISKQIKDTLARLSPLGKSKTSKHRREKRQQVAGSMMEEQMRQQEQQSVLKVTEFVTANDLAVMMNVPVVKVIAACMSLGMPVSINQRLDAEALTLVAETFGFKVDFVSADVQEAIAETEEVDREEDMVPRAPVVTVMGHVDHGKTKLLDYIRNTNVVAGEAGGITQHIGAYEVTTSSGRKITFLDTPGHEAFTAMRARGAKMTDVAIIVIATDDNVMPQTVEAINHAQAAGVPIVFALNKIDKPTANPDKIREQLSKMNILVESWGGKYQEQEIAAKTGLHVDELLEKVLLEAEFLDLKANPNKLAKGTVIESALDKGRGYVAKILVQSGTLRIGDMVLAGTNFGKVKAMFNDHNQKVTEAGPSTPVLLLGLNGAPQPGDTFNVMTDEREVKDIANRREQLQREQTRRTSPHITLDEIGRRIAIGDFKELNIIVKADVDGSVEALSDSLLKLSTEEVQVNVIHKSVGAISESDIMLASASNAVIVGFNVRPTVQARKLAEQEKIDIRIYSIIYQAIEEIKSAIEGMLAPEIEEVVTCNLEIRETFKISKVGTIAGCMVLDGKITRNTKIRIIRDGIVIYTGTLGSLKRYKDDVKEVAAGMDCGLNIENFNDIKVGDIIEGYTEKEIARKL